jgi:hypothetical protein
MRLTISICAILLLCSGCGRREQPVLQPFVGVLGDVWPRANSDLKLKILARDAGGTVILHCVLKNTSQVPVVFDESTLPWRTQGSLGISAVTADGKVFSEPPPPADFSRIVPPKNRVVLKSGDSLEGDVDLASLTIGQLPRNEDVVLVWSFWLGIEGVDQAPYNFGAVENPFFSGLAFLPKIT